MTSVIAMVLLAFAPIAVCYVAWWYQFGRASLTDAQHHIGNGRGYYSVPWVLAGTALDRVSRWVEDGRTVFESIQRALHERDQLRKAVDAAQEEQERLKLSCAALREKICELEAEILRIENERVESARWCAALIREAAARLQIESTPV